MVNSGYTQIRYLGYLLVCYGIAVELLMLQLPCVVHITHVTMTGISKLTNRSAARGSGLVVHCSCGATSRDASLNALQ